MGMSGQVFYIAFPIGIDCFGEINISSFEGSSIARERSTLLPEIQLCSGIHLLVSAYNASGLSIWFLPWCSDAQLHPRKMSLHGNEGKSDLLMALVL